MAELYIREPLFPGTTDFDQMGKIVSVLGSINEENWPGVSELPHFI
jgi:hypothetical protein